MAGTGDAVSALQMDVKVNGLTFEILSAVLKQAKFGRMHILKEMDKCDPPVRKDLSPYAPHISIVKIDPANNGRVIGPGGQHIRALTDISGVTNINVDEDGEVEINGPSHESVEKCTRLLRLMASNPEVGTVLENVEVTGIKDFGAFVDFAPGRTGLVHVSELMPGPVTNVADVVSIGDRITVKVIASTAAGKTSLSRKALMPKEEGSQSPGTPSLQTKPVENAVDGERTASKRVPNARKSRSKLNKRTSQPKAVEKTVAQRGQ